MKLNNTVMMGRLPGFLLYMGVVAKAKLVVLNQDELLLSRLVVGRQVLRLTQKVRREYEHPESAQLNFEATFCGIFSL